MASQFALMAATGRVTMNTAALGALKATLKGYEAQRDLAEGGGRVAGVDVAPILARLDDDIVAIKKEIERVEAVIAEAQAEIAKLQS